MIASKDVEKFFRGGYIHGAIVVPKPSGSAKAGKWSLILETEDGYQWMMNQRGQVYTFGNIDSAGQFLVDKFEFESFEVDLAGEYCELG